MPPSLLGGNSLEFQNRFPASVRPHIERTASISSWLRKEREFSFYGDVDFIPTEEYSQEDALRAIRDAQFVVEIAKQVIPLPES